MSKNQSELVDQIDFDAVFNTGEEATILEPELETEEEVDEESESGEEETVSEEEESTEEDEEANADEASTDDSEEEVSGEPESLVEELKQKLGYEIEEEFEDTTEGLVELFRAVAEKKAEEALMETFEPFPEVAQHLQYLLNGGSSKQFYSMFAGGVDFSEIKLSEDDVATQEQVIRLAYESKGYDAKDIADSISDLKNSGLLLSTATREAKVLAKQQEEEQTQLLQEQQAFAEQQQEQVNKFWGDVETNLKKSNSFKGIPISEKEKGELLAYIKTPINKQGQTAFQIAQNDMSIEEYLAVAALMKKGFSLDNLVNKKAASIKAQNLRDRLKNKGDKLKGGQQAEKARRNTGKADLNVVSFDIP